MRSLLSVFLLSLLAGCQTMGNQGLTADQLKAIASDKNFSAVCSTLNGVYGSGKLVYVNVDKTVVVNGSITVSPDCVVTMSNEATAAIVGTKTPAPPAKTP